MMLTIPDWSIYHKTSHIHEHLHKLARENDDIMTIERAQSFHENEEAAYIVTLTSRQPPQPRKKQRVLFIGGEHGRELITGEILYHWVTRVVANYGRHDDQWTKALLRHTVIKVVVIVSPWSRRQVEMGRVCTRKNHHGVDVNRNYDYVFNAHPDRRLSGPLSSQYPGPHAFSEPESQVIRDLTAPSTTTTTTTTIGTEPFAPDLYVNVHSGITEMYIGWDHRAEYIPTVKTVLPLLEHLNARYCHCKYGAAGAIGGYAVYGSSMDYLYARRNVTYSLTVEVYGGQGSPRDCFAYFNPTTRTAYRQTVDQWYNTLLEAVAYVVNVSVVTGFPLWSEAMLLPPNMCNNSHPPAAPAAVVWQSILCPQQQQQPQQQQASARHDSLSTTTTTTTSTANYYLPSVWVLPVGLCIALIMVLWRVRAIRRLVMRAATKHV